MQGLSLLLVFLNLIALVVVLATASRDPALTFVCAGLVTLSWDRVSIIVGPMTLKVTYVAFALAFAFELVHPNRSSSHDPSPGNDEARRPRTAIARGAALCLVLMALSSVASGHLPAGVRQLFVIVVGAVIPGWVTYRVARTASRRSVMIAWAFVGAAVTSLIAIYQFTAVRLGLPTILPYEGIAQGLGRTAGLSYEPAFLAMYLLSLTPLIVGRMMTAESHALRRAGSPLLLLVLFTALLANSRAGYLVLVPAVVIPIFKGRPKQRGTAIRALVLVGVAVLGISYATGFDAYRFTLDRLGSIGDRTEEASNKPRLRQYKTELDMARDHPLLGIGPGSLSYKLPEYGLPLSEYLLIPGLEVPAWRVVANNIWLQMMLDGGLMAFAGMAWVLSGLLGLARGSSDSDSRWLATGCLLVLLGGGMLTSIFWDVKLWALIGMSAGATIGSLRTSSSRDVAADAVPASQNGVGGQRVATIR